MSSVAEPRQKEESRPLSRSGDGVRDFGQKGGRVPSFSGSMIATIAHSIPAAHVPKISPFVLLLQPHSSAIHCPNLSMCAGIAAAFVVVLQHEQRYDSDTCQENSNDISSNIRHRNNIRHKIT